MLCSPGDTPAIYQVLSGEVHLQSDSARPVVVSSGGTFGVVETLGDLPWSGMATVSAAGRALRVDRADLFAALQDIGFVENLLIGVLSLRREGPTAEGRSEIPSAALMQ